MYRKIWELGSWNKQEAKALAEACDIDPFLALLLQSRGYTDPLEADEFLSHEQPLEDPYLLTDMAKAAARIRAALENKEPILIFGDYDCDGVTATVLLYRYLHSQGALVDWYIPNRSDGYGLRKDVIDDFSKRGVRLVITVDTGITALEEVAYANAMGMEVIVTDHHLPGETLPPALAVVDPCREDCRGCFQQLAGVGVAYLLICALAECVPEELLDDYSPLVALGTVADVMPLTGVNRVLVSAGLARLTDSGLPGLSALLDASGALQYPISASTISFYLGPRINAAGRMGDARRSVRLFLTDDPEEARALASEICGENVRRQQAEEEILKDAEALIAEQGLSFDRILVAAGPGWHPGVVGIAASKLVERYGRPVLLLSIGEDGVAVGSGRSFHGCHLYKVLDSVRHHLLRFGGHEMAVGLSLEAAGLPEFRRAVNASMAQLYPDAPFLSLHLDCRLNPAGLNADLVRAFQPMAPFGAGNPQPLFGLFDLEISAIRGLKNDRHVKLTLQKGHSTIDALLFGVGPGIFPFQKGDRVDLAVSLELRTWQEQEQLSVLIRDIRPSGLEEGYFHSIRDYEALRRGEDRFHDAAALWATREDAVRVFRAVRTEDEQMPLERLYYRLLADNMPYCKIRICLDALVELKVLLTDGTFVWRNPHSTKVDLESSAVLQKARQRSEEGQR